MEPAAPFLASETVRAKPFSTPQMFLGTLTAGSTFSLSFEIGSTLSDRNIVGNAAAGATPFATGFIFDASAFSDQAGTLDVGFWIQPIGTAPVVCSVMPGGTPVVVAANTLAPIAGLRIVGLGVLVSYKNTAGVSATVKFFAAVRSL